jgi:hypothetical protein
MPPNIFNTTATVRRSSYTTRDSLNNPVLGTPTTWPIVYSSMPCKFAFSSKSIQFAQTGERPEPSGIMYFGNAYTILSNDRVITTDASPIEYVVVSVVPAYLTPTVVSHYEAVLSLPT